MREILFKAKRTANGEWVEGYLMDEEYINVPFNDDSVCGRFDEPIEIDPSTICQYTGLTDKNGKKIWENDIVKSKHGYIGIIRYGQYDVTYYGFYTEWINGDEALRTDLLYWLPQIRSIGNIFDNPELLEEGPES